MRRTSSGMGQRARRTPDPTLPTRACAVKGPSPCGPSRLSAECADAVQELGTVVATGALAALVAMCEVPKPAPALAMLMATKCATGGADRSKETLVRSHFRTRRVYLKLRQVIGSSWPTVVRHAHHPSGQRRVVPPLEGLGQPGFDVLDGVPDAVGVAVRDVAWSQSGPGRRRR